MAPVFQLGVSGGHDRGARVARAIGGAARRGRRQATVNDVLTKLVGVSLTRHIAVNAVFTDDEISASLRRMSAWRLRLRTGLVVPVIKDVDRRTIQEIARARADLVGAHGTAS